MKYAGRIILLFIVFIFSFVSIFIFKEPIRDQVFDTVLGAIIAWIVGTQYDKAKFYGEQLQQSTEELQSLFDNNFSFLWSNDLINQKVIVSRGIEEMYGYSRNEFKENYHLWIERVHPDDKEKVSNYYQQLSRVPSYCEWRIIHKSGEVRWVESYGKPIFNTDGIAVKLNGVIYDISKRKHIEIKKLADTDKKLNDIKYALNASSIVAITDQHGLLIYVNDKFCEISKYNRQELLGQDFRSINSSYHPKSFFKELWEIIERGHIWRGEIKNKAKDDTYYWEDTTIVPFLDETNKPYQYVTIRNDITARKKTEELLLKSEKLSAIGELAAGVAHEIRNPLTSIKGFITLLEVDNSDTKNEMYFEILKNEIDRINLIVSEFMVLAKPHVSLMTSKNLIPIIKDIITFLESEANLKSIQILPSFKEDNIVVECEENQLKQVFLNIIKNAMEATPNGGDIHILVEENENKVEIKMIDHGTGMTKDRIKKLGEPFYTTKEKGTGLGLMVSFKIIENHNGTVNVESEEGKGTTFTIILPCVRRTGIGISSSEIKPTLKENTLTISSR